MRRRPSPCPSAPAFVSLLPYLALAFASASASVTAGCGGDEATPLPGRKEQITAGDISVRVDTGPSEITLLRGETVLLRFPAGSIELGSVPALSETTNYDPYRLYAPSPLYTPPDVTWRKLASMEVSEVSAASFSLTLTFEGGLRGALRIDAIEPESGAGAAARPPGSRFKAVLTPMPGGPDVAYFRLRPRIDPSEAFYGLGEYFDDVNHRGKIRAMQLEFTPELESSYNEAHVPVPFVIGTLGWGLFVESPYPGVFAVAAPEDPTALHAAFGTGLASSEGLTFHLFGAGHPLDVTRLYYDVTGYPRLPARWALGPWIWRDESKDQAEVESDLNTIRDLDLATTGYWIDRPYATGVNTFDFKATQFPTAQAMIDLAHSLGFRMALWHTPYLDESDPSTAALRKHATDNGFYPVEKGILLNKWGTPVDLTNPDAYAWWQELIRSYTTMGIEGFKMDYGEDVVPGLTAERNRWVFHDTSDERTMHARFQLFYHKVYSETLPEDGGFLLCRGGTYGDQQNVSVIWPGDLDASFARHGEQISIEGDAVTAVGGLPASIVAGLSLGPSGFPFYGADTGGYRHSPPSKELFTRWFEQTALSTVMQIGTSSNTVAWEPSGGPGFDDEMLGWYRTYTRLHLRLFPYEWTYAKRLLSDGRPIQRALGLAYPELGAHPSDTYLFGDHLLVAPVVEEGKTSREVQFPPGGWVDWWTGEAHEGGKAVTVDAPLGKLPLFMAAGSVVPLLRPTIDAMGPTTDPTRVDSYATTPGLIYARVVAGPKSVFTLFDGAEAAQELLPGSIALSWKAGSEFTSGAIFEVIALGGAGKKPSGVTIGGAPAEELPSLAALEAAPSGWAFDAATGGTVYVKVGTGEQSAVLSLP